MIQSIAILVSYLVGSIPFGLIVAKRKRVNLSKVGSGNIGATNVYRALGLRSATLVFSLDLLKGLAGTKMVPYLMGQFDMRTTFLCGLATIAGSVASIYSRFKGGKGVAAGVGVFLGFAPVATAICIGIWALVVLSSRYVSLGSIIAAIALPAVIYMLEPEEITQNMIFWLALAVAAIIAFRHRSNIRRLLKGEENKIGTKRLSKQQPYER